MGTANRVSIRPYLVEWLKQIGREKLGTDDLTEVVNYIILDKRTEGMAAQSIATSAAPPQPSDPTLSELSELLN
ncbi:hypothetical protein [Leptolyngbya ohadii]|uniref:hypothetical protein n=1 Tax=Leptolyngbya ohadii TaxID=1962290 RepID=UPI000B59C1CC|nr:hypothetical protein [Leptolyngbya ohadii]